LAEAKCKIHIHSSAFFTANAVITFRVIVCECALLFLQKETARKPRSCIRLDASMRVKKLSNSSLFEVVLSLTVIFQLIVKPEQ